MMPGFKNLKLTLIIWLSILCVPAQAMAAEQNSGIGIGFLKMQKFRNPGEPKHQWVVTDRHQPVHIANFRKCRN